MSLVPRNGGRLVPRPGDLGASLLSGLVREGTRQLGRAMGRAAKRAMNNYTEPSAKRTRRAYSRKSTWKKKRPTSSKCKIKQLCKFMNQQQAIHEHYVRYDGNLTSAPNLCSFQEFTAGGSITAIKVAMAGLRFYDPGTNALVTADASIGNYSRDVIVAIKRTMRCRNNGQVPVTCEIWSCTPRDATTKTVLDYYNSGLLDQGNPAGNSPFMKLTNSLDLRNTFACKRVKKKYLLPGQSCSAAKYHKAFDFNISTTSEHALAYQAKQGGHIWVVRIVGDIGHIPTDATAVGVMQGSVDVLYDTRFMFKYDAGKDLHDYSINDNAEADASAVCSQRVTDNQIFSLA